MVKNCLDHIKESARAAVFAFKDYQIAKTAIEKSNFLFPTLMGVYLRNKTLDDLVEKEIDLESLLINKVLHVLKDDHDPVPIHSYLNNLSFCYSYQFDKQNLYRSDYVFSK